MMECGTVVMVMVDERCLAETAQLRWLTCHAMVSPQSFNTLIHGLIPLINCQVSSVIDQLATIN